MVSLVELAEGIDDTDSSHVFEVAVHDIPVKTGCLSVIGPRPVARTAAVVGTAAVVAHGHRRRSDRREDRRDDRGDRREDRRDRRRSDPARSATLGLGALEASGCRGWTELRMSRGQHEHREAALG